MNSDYSSDIPYLTTLTKTDVCKFLLAYESYAARRTKAKDIGCLISAPVLNSIHSIAPKMPTVFTFDQFKQTMQNLYGMRSTAQTLVALQKIAMKTDGTVDSLMRYWQSYQDILLFTPKLAMPSAKQLAGGFKGGIRPPSVQNLLLLLKPESMEETLSVALGLLQEEDSAIDRFRLSRQVKAPVTSDDTRGRSMGQANKRAPENKRKATHTGEKRAKKSKAQRSTAKSAGDTAGERQACFTCGEVGHWASNCPSKPKDAGKKGKARAVRASNRPDTKNSHLEKETSDASDTPAAQVRKLRRSARIEELRSPSDEKEQSPSLMRICRIQELFPKGIPLASVKNLAELEDGTHAWSQDDHGRLHAIREPTPASTLMTNSAASEQGCLHIQEQALPDVPMTLRGQLMPTPDSPASMTVSVLLDAGATVSTMEPEIAKKLCSMGAVMRPTQREVLVPGNAIVHPQGEIDATLQVTCEGLPQVKFDMTFLVLKSGSDILLSAPVLAHTGLIDAIPMLAGPRPEHEGPVLKWDPQIDERLQPDDPDDRVIVSTDAYKSQGGVIVASSHLTSELDLMVQEFGDVFTDVLCPIGADTAAFTIELMQGTMPKSAPPRRQTLSIRDLVKLEVAQLMEASIIEKSRSGVSSPVVMVRQKGKHRFCIDYGLVNECTVPLRYPLPNLRAILQQLAGNKWFATLDLKSGYHQIVVHPDSRKLTAFVTTEGIFQFKRVPFGLMNAPAFFQLAMAEMLSDLLYNSCLVYIDDIVVFGDTENAFLENLRAVLQRLRTRRFVLRPDKCRLGLQAVEYLGHIVDGDGVRMTNGRIEAVQKIDAPTSAAGVKAFMGLANYFRAFVPNFSIIARPLNALTSPKKPFDWNPECENAFTDLK